mgnify:CR=1 FL=1|tara:strand:- start:502 stop:1134 length:633 start_codon:yes stop_codon:yes gene_type:complete
MKKLIYQEERGEDHLLLTNNEIEIGVDEVGRGCIFGPVFSAAVVISKKNNYFLKKLGVNDSKKLSRKKRESLIPFIKDFSEDWSLGQSSVREIEKYGIRYATELSMVRAIDKLKNTPIEIYIDGPLPLRLWKGKQENIIRGDSIFTSIAAASLLAKVSRDSLMTRLEKEYDGYFIHKNKGYGTKDHFLSIEKLGTTNMHRKSFLKKLNLI